MFADRYMIERTLGRGASATVYLAHDTRQDREIALKVLDNALASALGAQRFLQEIRITSRLQHPHILPIHDSGEWNGFLYYVCPFVAGESLRARLDREKQLSIEECVRLTCDVASALGYAHSKGVIHRDVKPENILLSDGHALVADFGIARTMDIHTGERLTSSGLIIGTSQYMSPEQASGEREIDFRSDIYSLGCVLYEMLAGIEPFVGPNVQAVIAQRFTHAPRPVSTFRPAVPDYLVKVLNRALAISPADRFQSMKELEAALPTDPGTTTERRRPGRQLRDFIRTRSGKLAIGAIATLAIIVTAGALSGKTNLRGLFARAPQLDSSLYVVLPLLDGTGGVSEEGRQSADHIYAAMQNWSGLPVVPDRRVHDAIESSGYPTTVPQALERAKAVGAGRMVWGTLNSPTGRLQLWDVQSGRTLREVAYVDSLGAANNVVNLFRDPAWPSEADAALGNTKSFAAWQAYGRAQASLKNWDVVSALADFDRAAGSDNQFVSARLWSAQIRSWMEDQTSADSLAWRRDAVFAATHDSTLSRTEALLARALSAMAAADFANACTEYRKLVTLDSTEFIAWHGLGKCEMLDETVVRSGRSPSGFVFRTSYADAARNFARALELDARAHAVVSFSEMQRVLVTSPTKIRVGTDPVTRQRYAAYPVLDRDTIAYVPYPLATFATLTLKGRRDALDVNALSLLAYTNSWVESEPNNSVAWEAHAATLETVGRIDNGQAPGANASSAVEKALKLTSIPESRVRLLGREVRLKVKRGEFAAASKLADSVLANTHDSIATLDLLALASFSGRIERMTGLLQRKQRDWLPIAARQYNLMPDMVATAAALFAHAAVGDCGPDIGRLENTFDNQLESYVDPDKRDGVRHVLLSRTYSLLVPCTDGASAMKIKTPENLLYRMQQAYAKRNMREMKLVSDSLEKIRAESRPGDRPADFTYQEAWLLAATGDTAGAIRKLDLALNALPSMSQGTLAQPAAAAAVGRMMVLRAEIASKTRDMTTARRWAKGVTDLWGFASKPLAPTVGRMRGMAAGR
jgi:serine/threonine protein kinase/tetratricopeptide (TPR) repeat protein